jgi:hypothetical protein
VRSQPEKTSALNTIRSKSDSRGRLGAENMRIVP